MDIVSSETRSRMMANIKGRDTKPEVRIRQLLHSHGFRFRIHYSKLPGKPDIALPKFKLCIFVHGCFWHRHKGCKYTTFPKTKVDFWKKKFDENVARDKRNKAAIISEGWRVIEIWECGTKGSLDELSWLLDAIPNPTIKERSWP